MHLKLSTAEMVLSQCKTTISGVLLLTCTVRVLRPTHSADVAKDFLTLCVHLLTRSHKHSAAHTLACYTKKARPCVRMYVCVCSCRRERLLDG
jgi:hypothetical protein